MVQQMQKPHGNMWRLASLQGLNAVVSRDAWLSRREKWREPETLACCAACVRLKTPMMYIHVDGSETKYRHGSKRPEKGRCFSKLLPLSTIVVCQHAGECLRCLIMSDVNHKLQHFSPGLFRGFSVFLVTLFLGAFVCTYIAENVSQHSNFTTATFRPRVSRGTCRAGAVG